MLLTLVPLGLLMNKFPFHATKPFACCTSKLAETKAVFSTKYRGTGHCLTALFIILGYLRHETSFERFHQQADRIYRITYHYQTQTDFEAHWARVPVNYVNQLPEEIPEIEQLIRFQNQERKYVRVDQHKFRPEHAYLTDAAVFEVFNFDLVEGTPKTALSEPYAVVLTQSTAEAYFGTSQALGKTLFISGDFDSEEKLYTVKGIMKDLPAHTHLPVDMLLSFTNPDERSGWAYVYTLLAEGTEAETVKSKFPPLSSSTPMGIIRLPPNLTCRPWVIFT